MNPLEKLQVLLPHWIEHNSGHAEECRKWAALAAESGASEKAGVHLEAALVAMESVGEHLEKALAAAGGEKKDGEGGHHHHHH